VTLIYLHFPVSRPTGCFSRLTAFSVRPVAAGVRAAQAYRRRRRFRRMLYLGVGSTCYRRCCYYYYTTTAAAAILLLLLLLLLQYYYYYCCCCYYQHYCCCCSTWCQIRVMRFSHSGVDEASSFLGRYST
jgi:uncharacterized membrane protein